MIDCDTCKRKHRDIEAVEKCQLRAEKRAERAALKKADVERRLANRKKKPESDFIVEQANKGMVFERIVTALNRDYPQRESGPWTLFDVIYIDSAKLKGTWPTDQETIALLRLERIHTGDFISKHPLALPMDGSYSMRGVA